MGHGKPGGHVLCVYVLAGVNAGGGSSLLTGRAASGMKGMGDGAAEMQAWEGGRQGAASLATGSCAQNLCFSRGRYAGNGLTISQWHKLWISLGLEHFALMSLFLL